MEQVCAESQVEQNDRLVAESELCVFDKILMSMSPTDVYKVSSSHGWRGESATIRESIGNCIVRLSRLTPHGHFIALLTIIGR